MAKFLDLLLGTSIVDSIVSERSNRRKSSCPARAHEAVLLRIANKS